MVYICGNNVSTPSRCPIIVSCFACVDSAETSVAVLPEAMFTSNLLLLTQASITFIEPSIVSSLLFDEVILVFIVV